MMGEKLNMISQSVKDSFFSKFKAPLFTRLVKLLPAEWQSSFIILLIRNSADPDTWNDLLLLMLPDMACVVAGTVDPGLYWKGAKRFSQAGTGRLSDGLQQNIWKWRGNWRGEPCLCNFPDNGTQRQRYYRDRNDNDYIDADERQTYSLHAMMHLHYPLREGKKVYSNSAGCVVPAKLMDHRWLMKQIQENVPEYKTRLFSAFMTDTKDAKVRGLYDEIWKNLEGKTRGEIHGEN